ncbi:MAG: serine/threonine-protein kinase, partial [Polyangiaceae bacterium]
MGCLDQNTLARLHGEQLGTGELLRVQQHLAECDDCRDLSAAVHLSIVGRATAVQRSTGVTRIDRRRQPGGARDTEQMTAHMNVTRLDDELGESAPEHAPHLWAGDSLDHYEVLLMLGRGAMGEVYLAQDTKLGRKVALKLMRSEMFQNDEAARRFQNEARAMAQINHPNVVTIHAVGEHEGVPYVAMEFVRGQSLYERLDPGLDDEEARRIALAVASALQQAHELGIVHRDLKPENVIAARDGAVKVLDFGLAKTVAMDEESSFADTPMPGGDEAMT